MRAKLTDANARKAEPRRAKLTDAYARKAEPGLHWDTHPKAPKGFLLRVTPAKARAWCLNYRRLADGVERRKTIGDTSAWPVADARLEAAKLRRRIDQGSDPLAELEAMRSEPSVDDLISRFIQESLPRRAERTRAEYRTMLERFISPAIGKKKIGAVERADLEKLHEKITADNKPRRANAVLTIAHVLFEQAIVWGLRVENSNPATRVQRNREHPRQRFLTDEEIERLMTALSQYEAKWPDSVDQITLLLLTGARRGEVVNMRWPDLDLSTGVWSKPWQAVKQRQAHRLPLSIEAIELLRRRRTAQEHDRIVPLQKDDRVFRGQGKIAFRLERDWFRIRAAAQLEDVRLHDLRHAHASILVQRGYSLEIIGGLLGHHSAKTTSQYAHLHDQALRTAAQTVGTLVGAKK